MDIQLLKKHFHVLRAGFPRVHLELLLLGRCGWCILSSSAFSGLSGDAAEGRYRLAVADHVRDNHSQAHIQQAGDDITPAICLQTLLDVLEQNSMG